MIILKEPGRLIPLRLLFPRMDYPTDVMALYAEGCSVTRFLVEAKDRKTFLKFIAAGKKDGWDEAVERYYGYSGVEELEEAWLKRAATEKQRAADAELLQGRWTSTSWEEAGETAGRGNAADYQIEFRDDAMTMRHRIELAGYRPTRSDNDPETHRVASLGSVKQGIYRLEGDRLTLCLAPQGPPPRRFATSEKDRLILIALKREQGSSKRKTGRIERPISSENGTRLRAGFRRDQKSPIKLRRALTSSGSCSQHLDILDDGRVKLSGCWYASFDKEKITTIRCNEAILSWTADHRPTRMSQKILSIEPSGKVRITFRPAEPDADSARHIQDRPGPFSLRGFVHPVVNSPVADHLPARPQHLLRIAEDPSANHAVDFRVFQNVRVRSAARVSKSASLPASTLPSCVSCFNARAL